MMWSPQKIPSCPLTYCPGRAASNKTWWFGIFHRSYKILMLWLLFLGRCCLFLSIHIVQEGFPYSQSPFGRPKWAQDIFWTFLEVVLSSISGWSGVKISLLWGAPPAATHPKGFVFIWEFPETFTCHCFCWSIPHHNWNTCFFRSYNLSSWNKKNCELKEWCIHSDFNFWFLPPILCCRLLMHQMLRQQWLTFLMLWQSRVL